MNVDQEGSHPESVIAPSLTINASTGIAFPARSDSRKVWLAEIRNNSLELDDYLRLIGYLELAARREFLAEAERAAEVHRRTLQKLAAH